MTQTTPHEIGLELVKLLITGKQPNKVSDELWQTALKLLNMRWQIDVSDTYPIPTMPHFSGCLSCGNPKGHGGLMCPGMMGVGIGSHD